MDWVSCPKLDDHKSLQECLAFWQAVLGLHPWSLIVEFARGDQLEDDQAQIDFKWIYRMGRIRVRHPVDWYDFLWQQDIEISIVHELMHLILWPITSQLDAEHLKDSIKEQIIEDLARAFVLLRRCGNISLTTCLNPNLILRPCHDNKTAAIKETPNV